MSLCFTVGYKWVTVKFEYNSLYNEDGHPIILLITN